MKLYSVERLGMIHSHWFNHMFFSSFLKEIKTSCKICKSLKNDKNTSAPELFGVVLKLFLI